MQQFLFFFFLYFYLSTSSFSGTVLGLSSVPLKLVPESCHQDTSLLIIIHSNPKHMHHRDILRKTWAKDSEKNRVRRVFVLGEVEDATLSDNINIESAEYKDILQGGFVDSYRNLTQKHLLWYQWVMKSCKAEYILKTDDDIFVDTFHLPRFLTQLPGAADRWFLCQVLDRKPERDPDNKWFVTQEEYSGKSYPPYCAGWAYVTTTPTIESIHSASYNLDPLWIDDLHVTGLIPASMKSGHIPLYDWSYCFLNQHSHYRKELFEGNFFTPELMVCGDINEKEIETLYNKAKKCEQSQCYDLIYKDEKFDLTHFAPKQSTLIRDRSEL